MEIKSNQMMKHKYCIICDVPFCRSASKKEGEDMNAFTIFSIVAINILVLKLSSLNRKQLTFLLEHYRYL